MKKSISILVLSSFVLFASAQSVSRDTVQSSSATSSQKKFSHWSMTLEAGTNVFDGDVYQESTDLWKSIRGSLSAGATVEYTFNPTVSLGLAYYYQGVNASSEEHYTKVYDYQKWEKFTSSHHQLYPFLSVNLLRVFNKNTKTKWGIWANVGLGAAYFNSDYSYWNKPNPNVALYEESTDKINDAFAVIVPVGVNFEYNFTKNFALGLKAQYITYNRDDLEGTKVKQENGGLNYAGVTNDRISTATITARWKFYAKKYPHTRNITWKEFEPNEAEEIAKKALEKAEKAVKPQDLDSLKKQIDNLWKEVDELKKRPIYDPSKPSDIYGNEMSADAYNAIPAVFFDFDKYNLDDKALETIYLVSQYMKTDPSIVVQVTGFCDYMGKDGYNKTLSDKRAERVKQELINAHGISADRIRTSGEGRVLKPESKYRPNRRAEFLFNK